MQQAVNMTAVVYILNLSFVSSAFSFYCSKIKVARYSFSGPIAPKFEHKLRRHKQSFGNIATTFVLEKDENLL